MKRRPRSRRALVQGARSSARSRSPRTDSGRVDRADYLREFLTRSARILVHSGHSPQRLWRDFRDVCNTFAEPRHSWDPTRLAYFADLPHIIAYWYSDPRYLDDGGLPIALPLAGREPSLTGLIKRVLPREDPQSVAATLVRIKAVRRHRSLYTPMRRSLLLSKGSARLHCMNTLMGTLRTVDHNVSGKEPKMLERTAMNPSFPVSALPALNDWVKVFADRFLHSADGYMQLQEGKDPDGPRVRVGVGVVVFKGPGLEESIPTSEHPARRSPLRQRSLRRRRRA